MVNLYKILSVRGTLFAFLLGLICIVIFAIPILGGISSFNALAPEVQKTSNIFNTGIVLMLVLLAAAVAVTVLWALVQMAMNPSGAKYGLIWLALFIGLFALGYFVLNGPDNQAILDDLKTNEVTPGLSKYIGGGIWVMLLMMLAAFGIFVISEIRNLFK